MKITELYIKNYGILEEVRLFPGRVNILSGDNGNGKSTVSQVIRYLFTNETVGSLKDVVRWGSSKFTIECKFSHLGKDYFYKVEGGTSTAKLLEVNGEKYENSEATKYLATIFNPKLIDYSNFALQDENTNVLFDKPTDRLNNIKSLLNMEFINKAVLYLKERNKNEKSEYEKLEAKKNSMLSFQFETQDEPEEVIFTEEEEYNNLLDIKSKYDSYIIKKQELNEYLNERKVKEERLSSLREELSSIKIERIRFDITKYESLVKEVSDLELAYKLAKSNIEKKKQLEEKSKLLDKEVEDLESALFQLKVDESYTEEELESLNKTLNLSEAELSSLKKDLKLSEEGNCPTCGQEFCIDKEDYSKKIILLEQSIKSQKQNILSYRESLNKNKSIQKQINDIGVNIYSNNKRILELQKDISELGNVESVDEFVISPKKLELSELEIKKKEFDTKKILNEQLTLRKEKLESDIQSILDFLENKKDIVLEEVIWTEENSTRLNSLSKVKYDYDKYISVIEGIRKFNKSILEKKELHDKEIESITKKMEDLQYSIGINNESIKLLDKKYSTHLISKGTSVIQDKMNEYFSRSYGKYSIAIKGDSNQVDFTYSNGKSIAPLIRASGQERDVFGIAFRIALNKLQSTNFFLGDEIDDSASMENSVKMLSNLLEEGYEQVWIVSHKETTKEILLNEFNAELFFLQEGKLL